MKLYILRNGHPLFANGMVVAVGVKTTPSVKQRERQKKLGMPITHVKKSYQDVIPFTLYL